MTNTNKQTIIDVQHGNITEQHSNDKAILVGVYPFKDSSYVEEIELVLNPENSEPITVKFPYSGYNMQLFIGDFTGNKKSEIMVRGGFGGSGGFEIGVIYKYENNQLIEIFNQNTFYKNNTCSAKYKENYKVSVKCSNKKYLIDISSKSKDYLNEIYSPEGKVKNTSQPYIDAPNGIYPLKQIYNDYYEIMINQRIVGIANSDTIAVIQTLANLVDSKFSTVYKGVLFPSYYYNQRKKLKEINSKLGNKNNDNLSKELSLFKRNEIYYGREFNIEKDNLDLIINSINEDRNTLYVDGYLLNLKNYPISKISEFNFQLRDSKGRLFAQKTFNDIDIQNSLKSFEGKRILLTFFSNEYSLFDADTSNLTWSYTYNIK